MAEEIATWPELYGADGIDLDIETGAGDAADAASNLVIFIERLNVLRPDMVVTQPVFGYPQVKAESAVVNAAWATNGTGHKPRVDAVGIMVYTGTQSLSYVKNYANGTQQWQGFPIKVDVPANAVAVGTGGDATEADIDAVAAANSGQVRGLMVWYASVIDARTGKTAFQYAGGAPDASSKPKTGMWAKALSQMSLQQ